jgi:hypothetical protein
MARFQRKAVVVFSSMLLILPFISQGTSLGALPTTGVMELEGNTVSSTDTDWQTLLEAGTGGYIQPKSSLPSGFSSVGAATSLVGSTEQGGDYYLPDKTTFATGSKDTLPITPGWQCTSSNNLGGKVDIVNAYAAVYKVPGATGGANDAGDTILYFGVEKASPNGDSNIAVWFLQDPDAGCSAGKGSTAFTGDHVDGDLLVVAAFTNGGSQANIAAYAWDGVTDADGDPTGSLGFLNVAAPVAVGNLCSATVTTNACAITNNTATVAPPWNHPDKNGGDLDKLEFFEGGVNLTEALPDLSPCFPAFLANTRSSQSPTATIFDFAEGDLSVCAPSTDLSMDAADPATVYAGGLTTFTFHETNDGNTTLSEPTGGFIQIDSSSTIENAGSCDPQQILNGDGDNTGDDNGNGAFEPGETWDFDCEFAPESSGTLVANGHGIDLDILSTGLDVTYCGADVDGRGTGDNAGKWCDSDEQASASVTRINPSTVLKKTADAEITYTYTERNSAQETSYLTQPVGDPAVLSTGPSNPNGNGGWVVDDQCAPVTQVLGDATAGTHGNATHNVGDNDNDNRLDNGETWRFECTDTLAGPTGEDTESSVVNTALGHGTVPSTSDDLRWCNAADEASEPAGTHCSQTERDQVKVTIEYGDEDSDL